MLRSCISRKCLSTLCFSGGLSCFLAVAVVFPLDGERAELIDGQIYYMAPPSRKHQQIVGQLFRKIANKYRAAGVKEYWIVDADKNRVMVYNFVNNELNEYSFTEDIPSGIYPGFTINLSPSNI